MESHEPVIGLPAHLLSLEAVNYVVAALLVVGNQRLGPEYSKDVLRVAEELRAERGVARAFHDDQ